jgi:hypothetical protein
VQETVTLPVGNLIDVQLILHQLLNRKEVVDAIETELEIAGFDRDIIQLTYDAVVAKLNAIKIISVS